MQFLKQQTLQMSLVCQFRLILHCASFGHEFMAFRQMKSHLPLIGKVLLLQLSKVDLFLIIAHRYWEIK